jgi:hypothetical protein
VTCSMKGLLLTSRWKAAVQATLRRSGIEPNGSLLVP